MLLLEKNNMTTEKFSGRVMGPRADYQQLQPGPGARAMLAPFCAGLRHGGTVLEMTSPMTFRPQGLCIFGNTEDVLVKRIECGNIVVGLVSCGDGVPAWFFNGELSFEQLDKLLRIPPDPGEDGELFKVLSQEQHEFIAARADSRPLFDFPTMVPGTMMRIACDGSVRGAFAWGVTPA